MSTSIYPYEADSNPENTIRLRRIPSATSSTYTIATVTTINPPPSYTSTTSLLAQQSTSTSTYPLNPSQTFIPTHAFQIQAHGHTPLSRPTSNRDVKIPIFSLPLHTTFTSLPPELVAVPKFLSIRPSRNSGSCNLISPENTGSESPLAKTTYRFGMGRPPVIKLFSQKSHQSQDSLEEEEEVILQNKSFFSRAVTFTSRNYGVLSWRYGSSSERKELASSPLEVYRDVNTLLLLESQEGNVVARFIRGEGTRTQGSGKSSAGNGGLLEVMVVDEGDGDREKQLEVLVIASCLVMMKKEVDRMRGMQAAAIGIHA